MRRHLPARVCRPEAEPSITQLAEKTLRQAGAVGHLPTPVDALIESAKLDHVQEPEPFIQSFLSRLEESARAVFKAGLQKIRGIADLRTRAIYVPRDSNVHRRLFAKSHELGHQVIPWHHVHGAYRDDDLTLSPEIEDLFDREANLFAAEVIFQGKWFVQRARDYVASFDAVFQLADDYGASRHATLWRFIEEHDEMVAVAVYWPSRYVLDLSGSPVLICRRYIASQSFARRFGSIEVPSRIASDHPWAEARRARVVCEGEISLPCDDVPVALQWQAWWNTYSLFVLLRRKPLLSVVGRKLRD